MQIAKAARSVAAQLGSFARERLFGVEEMLALVGLAMAWHLTPTRHCAPPNGMRVLAPRIDRFAPPRMIVENELYQECAIYDADMEEKMADLKDKLEKAVAMAALITEAQAATAAAQSELTAAQSNIALLETAAAAQAQLNDQLNTRLTESDAEASSLRVELASSSGSVASLESALEQQRAEQAATRQELEAERTALEAEKAANAAAEKAKAELRTEKAIAAAEAAKLAVNLANEKASAAAEQVRLAGELEAADATNAEYLKAIQEIATKCATLTQQVTATTNE